jgi:predicted metal-dependent HD superfamily phosphohydrolase
MVYKDIQKKVEDYISSLFSQHADRRLPYHNFTHTLEVVIRVREIAEDYKLAEESLFIAFTAAWFHDTGYLFVGSKGHEEESVKVMKTFLLTLETDPSLADKISQCIMATKLPVNPVSISEKILCDADTYHFGTLRFRLTNTLVKEEVESLTGRILTHWIEDSITLLTHHQFYTPYCRQKLNEGKKQNLAWLHSQL